MKILVISKVVDKGKQQESAIDMWRTKRPMMELQKHVDWQIDFQPSIIRDYKGMELDPNGFIEKHGMDEVRHLGQYDIIFTSYFTSPHVYTLLWGANKRYGTKYIIDFDDDLFDVDPANFAFWHAAGRAGHEFLKTIASVAPYISTTNEKLADKIRSRSDGDSKVFVTPNYISDMYPDQTVDNGDKVVIGFFGGASHYTDVHKSNLLPAVQKLMHEHKNVYFKACGQPIDHYLPSKRVEDVPVAKGTDWPTKRLPSLNLDIAVGPLLMTEFNQYKSNIKWQEATRMGSAFVASNTGPYKDIPDGCAVLVSNTQQDWYHALKRLVEDADERRAQVARAKEALKQYRLENNWQLYKAMFEEVANEK